MSTIAKKSVQHGVVSIGSLLPKPERPCLIIGPNGDGEQLISTLKEMKLRTVCSGAGQEAVEAIGRFTPGLIILFFSPGDDEDVKALRVIQDLWKQGQQQPSPKVIIVSGDKKAARKMLSPVPRRRCLILDPQLPDQIGQIVAALSKPTQRPRMVAQAALA